MSAPSPASLPLALSRDAFGRLLLADAAGVPEPVVPVRAFPLGAPDEGVSLVGPDGKERAWIERLSELPTAERALVEQTLAPREFLPVVSRIVSVATFATPSTWQVETDRGPARLVLKSEDDLRRLSGNGLLIASADGLHFRIPDRMALDRASRRLLDRFL